MVKRTRESIEKELTEVDNFLRHYSSLRYAALTVFFGLFGVTVKTLIDLEQNGEDFYVLAAKFFGLLCSFSFWFLERRLGKYILYLEDRGAELETELDWRIYSPRIRLRIKIKVFHVTNFLHLVIFLFWIFILVLKR